MIVIYTITVHIVIRDIMKQTTKRILEKNDYILTKDGLVGYLHDNGKLPFVSNMWRRTREHYMKFTIDRLEKYL